MTFSQLVGELPALVAFDLDGTLVDSVPDIAMAVDQMLAALGRPAAGEGAVRHWVGNGAEILVKRALANTVDESAVAAVSDAQMEEAFPLFKEFYHRCNGKDTKLYDGVEACLKGLFDLKIPLVVVTNKPKVFTDPLLKALAVDHYFAEVIGGDCFPEKKPSPMALNHLVELFQVEPSQCVMVGDSKHDVGAARAAGYKALCVSYGYNHGEPISNANPDLVVDRLDVLVGE
ncbi:MAG: phosphoglycolate phosphatase [Pseudomonadales bacterium]|nr:phosphoglycolate phosphatase [Pseudomonadales bacterium]